MRFESDGTDCCHEPRHEVDATLVAQIEESIKKGLCPPREIYRVEYRSKIDWSQLPSWALQLDPEVFDGCSHEG